MAKMMGKVRRKVFCLCCNDDSYDHHEVRSIEKRGWIRDALEEARDAANALPPDIREAALRSGTRHTVPRP